MKNKYNFEDDAWEELEEYYGDDLEANDPEFVSEVEKNIDDSFGSYEDNFIFELVGEDGKPAKYEFIGKIEIKDKTYLMLHPYDYEDEACLCLCRAYDDENGELKVEAISDPEEFKQVEEMANKLLYADSDDYTETPGGLIWDE